MKGHLSSEGTRKNIEKTLGVAMTKNAKNRRNVLTSHGVRDIMKLSRGAVMCDG